MLHLTETHIASIHLQIRMRTLTLIIRIGAHSQAAATGPTSWCNTLAELKSLWLQGQGIDTSTDGRDHNCKKGNDVLHGSELTYY